MLFLYATISSYLVETKNSRDERGATAVEYGLLVGLIAVAIVVIVGTLGGQLNTLFGNVSKALPGGGAAAAG